MNPMPERGTVLLVEANDGLRERFGAALDDAGYELIACPGPTGPDYVCIGGRESYCPLLERADVVVLDPWLASDEEGIGTCSDELVELYAGSGRTVIVLGPVGWLDPFAAGHVVHMGEQPDPRDLVEAVRSAPDADGFVYRVG